MKVDISGIKIPIKISLRDVNEQLSETKKNLDEVAKSCEHISKKIKAVAIAIGGVLTVVAAFVPVIAGLKIAFAALAIVVGAITAPIAATILGITALTAAIVLLWKNWAQVTDFLFVSVSQIKISFLTALGTIVEALSNLPIVGKQFVGALNKIQNDIANEEIKRDELLLASLKARLEKQQEANKNSLNTQVSDIQTALQIEQGYHERLLQFQINAGEKTLADKKMFLEEQLKMASKGTLREIEIRQALLDVDKQINDDKKRAMDARIQYEKAKWEELSIAQRRMVLETERAIIQQRLETAVTGTQEYFEILRQLYENQRGLNEVSNYEMASGFNRALQEMAMAAVNFKNVASGVFNDIRNAIDNTVGSVKLLTKGGADVLFKKMNHFLFFYLYFLSGICNRHRQPQL